MQVEGWAEEAEEDVWGADQDQQGGVHDGSLQEGPETFLILNSVLHFYFFKINYYNLLLL